VVASLTRVLIQRKFAARSIRQPPGRGSTKRGKGKGEGKSKIQRKKITRDITKRTGKPIIKKGRIWRRTASEKWEKKNS